MGDVVGGGDAGEDKMMEGGAVVIGEEPTVNRLTHCEPSAGKDAMPIGGTPTTGPAIQ